MKVWDVPSMAGVQGAFFLLGLPQPHPPCGHHSQGSASRECTYGLKSFARITSYVTAEKGESMQFIVPPCPLKLLEPE